MVVTTQRDDIYDNKEKQSTTQRDNCSYTDQNGKLTRNHSQQELSSCKTRSARHLAALQAVSHLTVPQLVALQRRLR